VSAVAEPVDIILLSYNRLEFLAQMVEALEERTVWPHRLTIVDNASGPETRQWLRENAARFHQIIWNERNEHLAGFQRASRRPTASCSCSRTPISSVSRPRRAAG
jgi:GT2 family glycosyltransferase